MSSFCFVIFFSTTESQLLNITSQPTSPVSLLEGQPLRLDWTFSVQRTFRRVQLAFSGKAVPFLETTLTTFFLSGQFTGRLIASATETNATITFLSVSKSDSNDYVFAVLDTDGHSVTAPFKVVVQCKYELSFHLYYLLTNEGRFLRLVWKQRILFSLFASLKYKMKCYPKRFLLALGQIGQTLKLNHVRFKT